jgi:hypothetical protein
MVEEEIKNNEQSCTCGTEELTHKIAFAVFDHLQETKLTLDANELTDFLHETFTMICQFLLQFMYENNE